MKQFKVQGRIGGKGSVKGFLLEKGAENQFKVWVLQVNTIGIAFRPFEGDAPRTIDMQAVTCGLSLQPMELHPGQAEIRQRACLITIRLKQR